jgi:hypothetical protein
MLTKLLDMIKGKKKPAETTPAAKKPAAKKPAAKKPAAKKPAAKKPVAKKAAAKKPVAKKAATKKASDVISVKELSGKASKHAKLIKEVEQSIKKTEKSADFKAGKAQPKKAVKGMKAKLVKLKTQHNTLSRNTEQLKTFLSVASKRSQAADKQRKALPPGKRISKTGNVYYETRFNHSDISRSGL